MRTSYPGVVRVDHQGMSFDVNSPSVVDLARGSLSWDAEGGCCDLCRNETQLFRLIFTPDALCASCFGMWHG